jgi:D-glycero-D-manno-heptose 1,7-bisphosphate phosphatase
MSRLADRHDSVLSPKNLHIELVLLDRDGVLNVNRDGGVLGVEQWTWLPGSVEAFSLLASLSPRLMIVTNQAAIGRGLLSHSGLADIHRHMIAGLPAMSFTMDDIFYCPHRPEDGCHCRKPRPGLVTAALATTGVRSNRTVLIGDHETDIAAAAEAGCWSMHVQSGRGLPPERRWSNYLGSVADLRAATCLLTAAK